jgi:nitroreductase
VTTPARAIDQAAFLAAVRAAILAPSMHNSQPWRFRLASGALEVHADPDRRLAVADPEGWAVRIACGAAVCNARLALAAAGVRTDLALRPDPDQPRLLASLSPVAAGPATPQQVALHAAIPHRHSSRAPFRDTPVPPGLRAVLRAAAEAAGAWLELLVGGGPLAVVSEIVWAADATLRQEAAYRAEQLAWSGRGAGSRDGVTVAAAGPPPAEHDLLPMRDFGGAARTGGLAAGAEPLVGVLGTPGDTPRDQLVAGIALQQVLLTATGAGLAVSLLSQAIEVPAARDQLRLGLGRRGAPQMVLRLGYGRPGVPSPRRAPAEVIDG